MFIVIAGIFRDIKKLFVISIGIVALYCLSIVGVNASEQCKEIIPPKFEEFEDVKLYGYFFHPDHCFSVVIPENVIARDHSAPQSHHGFGAVLSKNPRPAYLYVGAEPSGLLEDENDNPGTIESWIDKILIKQLVEDGAVILNSRFEKMQLADLPAVKIVATYACPGAQNKFMLECIVAAKRDGPVYEIYLESEESVYQQSHIIFEQIVSSWQLETQKCEEEFQKRLKDSLLGNSQ